MVSSWSFLACCYCQWFGMDREMDQCCGWRDRLEARVWGWGEVDLRPGSVQTKPIRPREPSKCVRSGLGWRAFLKNEANFGWGLNGFWTSTCDGIWALERRTNKANWGRGRVGTRALATGPREIEETSTFPLNSRLHGNDRVVVHDLVQSRGGLGEVLEQTKPIGLRHAPGNSKSESRNPKQARNSE